MKFCPCRLLPSLRSLSRADRHLAAWIALCLATLLPVVALLLGGALSAWDDAQLRLLAGHPFYIGAEEAQVSLLSPAATFFFCTLLTLWLSAVLYREHRYARRTQVAFLAALVVSLPGLLCVLWGGVLYVATSLLCVALLWCYMVPAAALWRLLSPFIRHKSSPSSPSASSRS